MASKKTKRPAQAKKVYMSASLITVGDNVIRPGDIVSGLSDADEKMYLDAGMIYPLDRFTHEKEDTPENKDTPENTDAPENTDTPENTDNVSENSVNTVSTEESEEDSKNVEKKEAGEA